jgi:peptidoglycan hydrolase CwlO-like protein
MLRSSRLARRLGGVLVLLAAAASLGASASAHLSAGQLQGAISADGNRTATLQGGIAAATQGLERSEGRLSVLQSRLGTLQQTLDYEDGLLTGLQTQLNDARGQLAALRTSYTADRATLAAQLVGEYEAPPPDLANMLVSAHGFTDLLERMAQVRDIARQNAQVTIMVKRQRVSMAAEVAHLSDLQARQQRITTAALVQRDEIAQVKLGVVDQELSYARQRREQSAALQVLTAHQERLQNELTKILTAEQAAESAPGANYLPPGAGYDGAPFVPHGGIYGFFPAPGTDYTVNEEPELEARLDALGIALHLHLIGISGYRTPAHSVAVGGFADDPHTRGEASDTPGIEGVPEAVLERFGLERPFPGAREADHIQLLGSPL